MRKIVSRLSPRGFLREARRLSHRLPSLYHYLRGGKEVRVKPLDWKEFLRGLLPNFSQPFFIPSIFSDFYGLELEREEQRQKRFRAGVASLFFHILALTAAVVLLSPHIEVKPPAAVEKIIYVSNPVFLPPDLAGTGEGGGGGGGGKREKLPPSQGVIPTTSRVELIPPEPGEPHPLLPPEETVPMSVVMPIDIFQSNPSLPIGDISAPPGTSGSSGPGSGGGIGTGRGTGIGSGTGPGVGPGSGGGMGGGSGGGIGSGTGPYAVGISGLKPPTILAQPLPPYTEEARKARAEGMVFIQAIVRKDGTVDSFKVLRGLGYGLDESAINAIANKWRFKPGTLNGVPVDVIINIEISFRIY